MLTAEFLTSSTAAIILVVTCVIIHYEMLHRMSGWLSGGVNHRVFVVVIMCGLILAHIIEIWVFAGGYYLAQNWLQLGEIEPITDWFDYVYYSSMVYTTVGFGDQVPHGGLRMITSAEALMGLALITWSASFTFLYMSRLWREP